MIKLLTPPVFKGQILEYLKVVATINRENIIYIVYGNIIHQESFLQKKCNKCGFMVWNKNPPGKD